MRLISLILALTFATASFAQTNINLGGISAEPSAPVEVSADNLSVDQDTGVAIFTGNVNIGQGSLRLSAGRVEVVYGAGVGEIEVLRASGGVTFVTDTEAAEAASAEYNLVNATLVLTGEVLLTQGASAISAERMTVNLETGNAQMSGQVRTIFQQGNN